MGYPHSLTGNEERRSERPVAESVDAPGRTRGSRRVAVAAGALVVTIVVLVAKPWSALPAGGGSASTALPGAGAAATVPATPTFASPEASAPTAPATGIASDDPIDPAQWSRISTVLGLMDRDGLVFVVRWPTGLFWSFVAADSSTTATMRLVPAPTANGARMTGYLARPVAIGITRRSGAAEPITLAWAIFGPGAEVRVPLRHPVGDVDGYLWLGPGFGLPRGEQRNRREISRWPPTWPAGVYRFELSTAAGTRYLFVDLEPDPIE
jgi:hypothetical protein